MNGSMTTDCEHGLMDIPKHGPRYLVPVRVKTSVHTPVVCKRQQPKIGATGLGYQGQQTYSRGLDLIYASPVVAWISSAYIRRSERLSERVIMDFCACVDSVGVRLSAARPQMSPECCSWNCEWCPICGTEYSDSEVSMSSQ